MKTLTVVEHGSMRSDDRPLPPLAAGTIRVRVRFAGVGFADVMAVRGGYVLAPRLPFSPGYEFFGHVVGAGSEASGFSLGARVLGLLPRMAAYREYLDLDPRVLVDVPDAVQDETAGALPLNYLTALALIEKKARLPPGGSFLIHGAAGGVGTAALELARLLGLGAFGTASVDKHPLIARLGALPLDRAGDWVAELKRRRPRGVDAAFDSFGGRSLERSWKTLAKGGTLVSYGFSPSPDGGIAPVVGGLLSIGIKGVLPNGRRTAVCATPALAHGDPPWYRRSLGRILGWAAEGSIAPIVHAIFPWDRAEEAHAVILARAARGKILLDFGSPGIPASS